MKVTTGIYMKTICENSSINMKLSRNISEKRVHSLLVGMFLLNDVVSVLIDLVRSHREADWDLHLSTTRLAIPLFFFFNCTKYKRWVPLYFEGCMVMKSKFPELWDHFSEGKFVVHQTRWKGSGILMNQALEKQYNKTPEKGPSGIIRFTRCKEVC